MFCSGCGRSLGDLERFCSKCGAPRPGPGNARKGKQGNSDLGNQALRMILPVGRSGWAIAAGYVGLFALAGIGAPFALILSVVAMADIKMHPEKRGMGRAIFALLSGLWGVGLLFYFFYS